MANVKIRLIVDTTKKNPGKNCYLVDNTNKLNQKRKPSNFCTKVDQGQTIEWSGLPLNPNVFDQVSIDSISYKKKKLNNKTVEKDLFGVKTMSGPNGVIYGTVIAKGFTSKDEESYKISFTVIYADGESDSFRVDPQIRVNT